MTSIMHGDILDKLFFWTGFIFWGLVVVGIITSLVTRIFDEGQR